MLQKIYISSKCFSFTSMKPENHFFFNIDNKKCFLNSKSAYSNRKIYEGLWCD